MDRHFLHMAPLALFTALATTAAGAALGGLGLTGVMGDLLHPPDYFLTAGLLGAAAVGVSFFHLGRKNRFWRAGLGIHHSWLSREVLAVSLFIFLNLAVWLADITHLTESIQGWLMIMAASSGLLLTATVALVYDLEARQTWRGGYNRFAPSVSALLLGATWAAEGRIWCYALLYTFWSVDFIGALGRGRRFFENQRISGQLVFPQLASIAGSIHWARLLTAPLTLALFGLGWEKTATTAIILFIFADRWLLYAGMTDISPESCIRRIKTERMNLALEDLPQQEP